MRTIPLQDRLDALSAEGEVYRELPEGRVRCLACAHRCLIPPGRRGVCQVRYNQDGRLRVPFGYVAGVQADPTEKKPFFHVLPGSWVLTFGMLGCDLHCAYCQNWVSSQALRDARAGFEPTPASPRELVGLALRAGARLVASSYNEPLITVEWAAAVFREARRAGLRTLFVSNGHATPEVLAYLRPWCDGYKIDLKSMSDRQYRRLGGRLEPVLETVRQAHRLGFWVEVVTLVVPGFNDSDEELREAAAFIASVSPAIPWHVTAFHPDYRMQATPPTTVRRLMEAARIGREAGLTFVYVGNVRDPQAHRWENTWCPGCGALLVERFGFAVTANRLTADGRCPECAVAVPGVWR